MPDAGAKAATKLLQQSLDDLPTAVYIGYDDAACSAMTMFEKQGFRIPEDLSIVGFDNLKVTGLHITSTYNHRTGQGNNRTKGL